jgi:predicted aspartyl protease
LDGSVAAAFLTVLSFPGIHLRQRNVAATVGEEGKLDQSPLSMSFVNAGLDADADG